MPDFLDTLKLSLHLGMYWVCIKYLFSEFLIEENKHMQKAAFYNSPPH